MNDPYNTGQRNAGHTDAAPSYQHLKNAGYSDTQAGQFLKGYADAKK